MRAGTPLLSRQADRGRVVQPGKESRETSEHLPVSEGAMRELERDWSQGSIHGTSQTYSHSFHLEICEKNRSSCLSSIREPNSLHRDPSSHIPSHGHCREPKLGHGGTECRGQERDEVQEDALLQKFLPPVWAWELLNALLPAGLDGCINYSRTLTHLRSRSLVKTVSMQATA